MSKFKSVFFVIAAAVSIFIINTASAHHSFAIFDIDNKIKRTGVVTKFRFANPHIQIVLDVTNEDGSQEVWEIESMNPSRWDSFDFPRDVMTEGETVTILGWPARDGKDAMALSTIITERGETVIRDQILQRKARENIPETTIKRN